MPSAAYFRRQADICLQLSLIASDEAVSSRLLAMAKDYQVMSEALEPPDLAGQEDAPELDGVAAATSAPPAER